MISRKRTTIIDEQFGRWTVKSYAGQGYWKCVCDCGTVRSVSGSTLRLGKSTGCLKCKSGGNRKHGERYSRLYAIWSHMKARCQNPTNERFSDYGERGISVCAEWQTFEGFRDWALANGYSKTLTIDRFPDRNGGYEPANCRWATNKQQNRNRRDNKPIEFEGETALISEFAERFGLPPDVVKNRIRRYGWPIKLALTTPVGKRGQRIKTNISKEDARTSA